MLGGGQTAGGAAPVMQNPQRGVFAPYTPAAAPSPRDLAYEYSGAKDLYQAAQAAQRGEYLPALGQGAYGAANMAGWALPVAGGVMRSAEALAASPFGRQVGKTALELLKDEFGGIKAYHGSPYDFERFDPSRIGTGEGAQAYGHGLYFAEAEPVAESYLKTPDWRYGGK